MKKRGSRPRQMIGTRIEFTISAELESSTPAYPNPYPSFETLPKFKHIVAHSGLLLSGGKTNAIGAKVVN